MSGGPNPVRMSGVGHDFGANDVHVRALDGINLEVEPGELLAVMGPSGSGKSTLLSIAGGLERPNRGSVFINGIDLATLDGVRRAQVRRRQIGYVFQDYNLIPSLSALENVEMPLQLDGVPNAKARALAMEALDEVGVGDLADRFPERLSGGQRQRIAIVTALLRYPRILVLDEATSALDTATERQVTELIAQYQCTKVVVAHRLSTVRNAENIVVMEDGRIIQSGRHDDLMMVEGRYRELYSQEEQSSQAGYIWAQWPPTKVSRHGFGLGMFTS